jgi:ribosomal protein S25
LLGLREKEMIPFKSTKRRKNDRQYIWEYMRRNRVFKVEDVLLIVEEMSQSSMQKFFRQLEHAGYIKVRIPKGKRTKPKLFRDRSYGLVKNSGVLCPVWLPKQRRLFDRNTQEAQLRESSFKPKSPKRIERRPVEPLAYAKGRIEQILKIEEDGVSLLELSERSGVSGGQFARALSTLEEEGVAKRVGCANGVPLYAGVW